VIDVIGVEQFSLRSRTSERQGKIDYLFAVSNLIISRKGMSIVEKTREWDINRVQKDLGMG